MSNITKAAELAIATLTSKRYVRISEKLAKRSAEVAAEVLAKMQELAIDDLEISGVGTLAQRSHKTSAGYYDTLIWRDEETHYCTGSGCLLEQKLGDGSTGYYVHGDFSHWVSYPTRDAVLTFALNIDNVFQAIAVVESTQADQCAAALSCLK